MKAYEVTYNVDGDSFIEKSLKEVMEFLKDMDEGDQIIIDVIEMSEQEYAGLS